MGEDEVWALIHINTNINSKYTVDLNVKGKVILGNLFFGLRVDKFLNKEHTLTIKEKIDKLTCLRKYKLSNGTIKKLN